MIALIATLFRFMYDCTTHYRLNFRKMLLSSFPNFQILFLQERLKAMFDTRLFGLMILICGLSAMSLGVFAQPQIKSQEVSDEDGIPVLIKHLPDWEGVRDRTTFTHSAEDLRTVLGDHSVLGEIDFSGGTEAVTAPYPAGKLLIIEYTNPQASADADTKFILRLSETPDNSRIVYRRIGNYNVFVFDAAGKFVRAFGNQFQGGGHGLEVRTEGKEQFLWVTGYQMLKNAILNS